LVARQLGDKVFGAAFGDGAQVVDGFLLAQADAVVGNRQRFGFFVEADAHVQMGCFLKQRRVVQRLKAQLVAGVGGVGDQLAHENLFVGVQRVGHEVQQLGYFGLEGQGLLGHGVNFVVLRGKFGTLFIRKTASKFNAACYGLVALPTD